jgi:chromate transporter
VWTSAIVSPNDFALALTGFILLVGWKAPPWVVVVLMAAGGIFLHLI